jgi:hypothetical protein
MARVGRSLVPSGYFFSSPITPGVVGPNPVICKHELRTPTPPPTSRSPWPPQSSGAIVDAIAVKSRRQDHITLRGAV